MSISNPRLQVKAIRLAEDGRGVAHEEDLEIYVTDLLPGEQAEIEIEHRSRHHKRAWGRIAKRIGEASSQRSVPACAAFGKCGGCTWQHLAYPGQLEQKRERLALAFDANLALAPQVPLPLAAPDPLHYRNKGKYIFGIEDEQVVLGAYKPRSHQVVSTLGCQIVEAAIDEVASELQAKAQASELSIYPEAKRPKDTPVPPGLRYAIMRSNAGGQVLLTLVCTSSTPDAGLKALADEMYALPQVSGVMRCHNDLETGALLTGKLARLRGAPTLSETLFGEDLELGPLSFWQVHRSQAERAYIAVADALPVQPDKRVLELYAGTGGIAIALAHAGHKVLGIDISEEAVRTANQVAQDRGMSETLRFECADASKLGPEYFAEVGAVVVDPPRKGLGKQGLLQLCQAMPARIAYLSCGPESLAADVATLIEAGYHVESLQAFDFMPGTAQVECLVVLAQH